MQPENEQEVFERASDAKARLNTLEDMVGSARALGLVTEIREDLEIIERRADPAR